MGISSVSSTTSLSTVELQDEFETGQLQEGGMESGASVPAAVAPVSAPLVMETSYFELPLVPEAAAMAMAASASDVFYVTFSSLDMAATVLGLSAAEKTTLAGLGTLTFSAQQSGANNIWQPVLAKRSGPVSFSDSSQIKIDYANVGSSFTRPRTNTLPAALTIDNILSMSSEDQRALVYQYNNWASGGMANLEIAAGSPLRVQAAHAAAIPALTIILGESGKPIVADQLDVRSIAKLTLAEQELLKGLRVFIGQSAIAGVQQAAGGLAAKLGLVATLPASIADAITAMQSKAAPTNTTLTNFSAADRDVFIAQLNLLKDRLSKQAIYQKKTIDDEVAAIVKRFETAYAYGNVNAEVGPQVFDMHYESGHIVVRYSNIISLDKGAAVKSGFESFMVQEKRLLELAQARAGLTVEAGGNRRLDVPTMIVRYQLYYNLETETLTTIKSEEVTQQNELLKTYAYAQKRVSELVSAGSDKDWSGGGGNFERDVYHGNKNNEQKMFDYFVIASMFQNHSETQGFFASRPGQVKQPKHPLETLRAITRPTAEIFFENSTRGNKDWGEYLDLSPTAWSQFGTRLADAVTLINQESQIQMNDISALEKEKNRYYEAGSNALSRLNELIRSIAGNV